MRLRGAFFMGGKIIMIIQPVILCGGSGTRLWPLSREYYPKQLLALCGDHSLLQETVLRLDGVEGEAREIGLANPLVISNEAHRFLVAEQLRELNVHADKIILEPVGRNTAPALSLAALAAVEKGEDPLLLVMPADHIIKDKSSFHAALRCGAALADKDWLVTFGVVPTAPETGYGYIKKGQAIDDGGASQIAQFVEKPDADTATSYLDSGEYLWNSGMFMMKASVWLKATSQYCSGIADSVKDAYDNGKEDSDFYRVDKAAFEACVSDSIDYAVMERIVAGESGSELKGAVVPLDAEWSDVGAWDSLWAVSDHDEKGNVIKGDVHSYNTKNSLLMSSHRLVAAAGLEDIIVVETADAVMVAAKDHAQDVKKLVESVKASGLTQHQTHRKVFRPWGCYESIDNGERFQVKRITVAPKSSLSLQMHHHRAEHWIVVKGTAKVTRGEEVILVSENESTYIPLGVKHRLENPGSIPLELIEVQSGSYLGEDDIVRFDDVYGRVE